METEIQLRRFTSMIKLKDILEAITIPIEIGDTVLGGKFKNKRSIKSRIN